MKVKSESEVAQSCPIFVTPWTVAYQAPLSMGFSRQEYWSGVPSMNIYIFTFEDKIYLINGKMPKQNHVYLYSKNVI